MFDNILKQAPHSDPGTLGWESQSLNISPICSRRLSFCLPSSTESSASPFTDPRVVRSVLTFCSLFSLRLRETVSLVEPLLEGLDVRRTSGGQSAGLR